MAAKKDLRTAAAKGADLFFSAADAANTGNTDDTHNAESTGNTVQPHRAQDEKPAQLAETIEEMTAAIEADEARKQERKRAKREEIRVNIAITPRGYEYARIMGSICGKGMGRFISDLLDREATTNNAAFLQAKELIKNVRGE